MLDDQFKTGIWYDAYNGGFYSLDYNEHRGEILLRDADNHRVLEAIDPEEFNPRDFYQVSPHVAADPAEYLDSCLDTFATPGKAVTSIPYSRQVDLLYAHQRTTIFID